MRVYIQSIIRYHAWIGLLVLCLIGWVTEAQAEGEGFYIRDYHVDIQVNQDGGLRVTERIGVRFTEKRRGIIRDIPTYYFLSKDKNEQMKDSPFANDGYYKIALKDITVKGWEHRVTERSNMVSIRIGKADVFLTGEQVYEISYTLYGAMKHFEESSEFVFNVIGTDWPVGIQKAAFTMSFYKPVELTTDDYYIRTGKYGSRAEDGKLRFEGGKLIGKANQTLTAGEGMTVAVRLPKDYIDPDAVPMELFAKNFHYTDYRTDIYIHEDGTIDFKKKHAIQVKNEYSYDDITEEVPRLHDQAKTYIRSQYDNILETVTPKVKTPRMRFLGRYYRYVVSDKQFNVGHLVNRRQVHTFSAHLSDIVKEGGGEYRYAYKVTGLLNWFNASEKVTFKVMEAFSEPAQHVSVHIHAPKGVKKEHLVLSRLQNEIFAETLKEVEPGHFVYEEAFVWEDQADLFLSVSLPKDFSFSPRLEQVLLIFTINHAWIVVCLIIFVLFFFLIWSIRGAKRVSTKMVRFYPPDDMNPALAGYLIDNKLEKRDLISLLYYWGAKGHIEVEEIYMGKGAKRFKKPPQDYKFILRKPLPLGAPSYERYMFRALFGESSRKGKSCRLSSLRNSFYFKLDVTSSKLKTHVMTGDYYATGAFEFKSLFMILGWVAFGICVLATLFTASEWGAISYGRWDIVIGSGLVALGGLGFGRQMVRRTDNGQALYEKLLGFYEFVKTAEKDRIEQLVNENPEYFGQTLSYAMAFGLAPLWVLKFKGLMEAPPEWYTAKTTFDYANFSRNLNSSTSRIQSVMVSYPEPTYSSSSSTSSYTYSSSSYSSYSNNSSSTSSYSYSSSSSFGSGSSGGGSYSGGGVGGGGGSSW